VPLRISGARGRWQLLLGNLAELDEDLFPLDVYRCSACKRIEFFDLDKSLPLRKG
jgi:hypothetical protein